MYFNLENNRKIAYFFTANQPLLRFHLVGMHELFATMGYCTSLSLVRAHGFDSYYREPGLRFKEHWQKL
jgi:hypothetical protein